MITCPQCRTARVETMPIDACQYYYECTQCKTLLRPKPGDCCVFCSYGSVPCPAISSVGPVVASPAEVGGAERVSGSLAQATSGPS